MANTPLMSRINTPFPVCPGCGREQVAGKALEHTQIGDIIKAPCFTCGAQMFVQLTARITYNTLTAGEHWMDEAS